MMSIKPNSARRFSYLALSAAVALTTLGCSDGKDGTDGQPGEPGEIVTTKAEVLTLNITHSEIANAQLSVDFTAYNEAQLPVVKIAAIKLDTAQLLPEFEGERSQWQTLSTSALKVAY